LATTSTEGASRGQASHLGENHIVVLSCSLCPYRPWIQQAFDGLALLLLKAAGTSSDDSAEGALDRADPEMGCGW